MFKKVITVISVVGALALVGGTLVYAAQPKNPISGPTTVQFTAKTNMQHAMNHPPRRLNIGDGFAFHDLILQNGKRIGADAGSCTYTQLRFNHRLASFLCTVTFALPRGQVNVQGLINFKDFRTGRALGVNGGTGAYRAARGVAMLNFQHQNLHVTLALLP
jgi:hypothetical protein